MKLVVLQQQHVEHHHTPSSLVLISDQVTSEVGNVVCTSGNISFNSRIFVAAKISFVKLFHAVSDVSSDTHDVSISVPTNMSR